MKEVDLSRWGLIAPNNDSGLGRMAQDLKTILPIGRHLVAESSNLPERPLVGPRETRFSSTWTEAQLESELRGFQGLIFFENNSWHPLLLQTARRMKIRTVCIPMWEWFRGLSPQWLNCDYFACPNEMCLRVVRSYGYNNSALVPWTLDLSRLPQRVVSGPARHFVHNAGVVDPDDRKGTNQAIAAFAKTSHPEIHLTVRMQKEAGICTSDKRIKLWVGNLSDPYELYAEGDAFIQPSKLEGMGFMVLEAVASGLPVITLDAAPMSEWVRQSQMLARVRHFRYPAYSSAWIEHSHLSLPHLNDLSRKIIWASENDLEAISRDNLAWTRQTFAPDRLRETWANTLDGVLRMPHSKEVATLPDPPSPCHSYPARARNVLESLTGWRAPFLFPPI